MSDPFKKISDFSGVALYESSCVDDSGAKIGQIGSSVANHVVKVVHKLPFATAVQCKATISPNSPLEFVGTTDPKKWAGEITLPGKSGGQKNVADFYPQQVHLAKWTSSHQVIEVDVKICRNTPDRDELCEMSLRICIRS